MATLCQIHVYPVKSCGGIAVDRWRVGARGLERDRELMAVTPAGAFLTQREVPRLVLVRAALEPDALVLTAPDLPPLRLPFAARSAARVPVVIWKDTVAAEPVGDEADAWMTRALGTDARLVRFPEDARRQVDLTFARPGDLVGFADGFSLLLVSEASLDALNARLEQPIGMNRFRPNLVVRGCEPFAEDTWRRIRIGALELELPKPCARCPIPTVDEVTATHGKEPLRTLATFRRIGGGGAVYFAQNAIHRGEGELAVGDAITVLETAPSAIGTSAS
ncbi:MAG TPA: MOSC N-terminal beta barrel domain-containing protein [Kofleriaceae bacterium]|nr:MOSC N-terminal beta barrel domain-containing protein [Kofleriaceae bacterium]